jgi:hypothetical protein
MATNNYSLQRGLLKLVRILMRARPPGERPTKAESKFQGRCCVREHARRFVYSDRRWAGGRVKAGPPDRGTHATRGQGPGVGTVVVRKMSVVLVAPRNASRWRPSRGAGKPPDFRTNACWSSNLDVARAGTAPSIRPKIGNSSIQI